MSEPSLFPLEFHTARPSRPLYCHQEFLDKLEARRNEPAGKRAALLMQRMAVDIARLHYKGTTGVNRGWRRSRLGGGSGSHFYAWWAPTGSAPLKRSAGFDVADAVFLRDIRHHDDHTPVAPGDPAQDYLPLGVPDLRGDDYAPAPWTAPQSRFARSRAVARILKGHPGSGKTTALLHAADESRAERVLYLTFSRDLAALARDYFDRFCSDARTFHVLTFPDWLRQVSGRSEAGVSTEDGRARFRRDLANHQRALGAWSGEIEALYDEMHAHLVGAALPEKMGRFPAAERVRLPDAAYRSQRARYLGPAAETVLDAAHRLERLEETPLADRYFPELAAAWRAAHALARGKGNEAAISGYGCIAVDEVQDLTPLEAYSVIALARRGKPLTTLLLAGDEAQTVRATDFEWAWLNDMLHDALGAPQEFKLAVNLRSPRRIAELVNRAWDLYDHLLKHERPSGSGSAEIEDDSPDEVLYATAREAEVPELLSELSAREGLALIAFDKTGLPAESVSAVLSPAEAKGLDFHSVCVLNGGALLKRIADERATSPSSTLGKRLAIDQLRVALSRPTERLIWVDIAPDPAMVRRAGTLLSGRADSELPPMTVEALRASFAEEELDLDERVQRCLKDARQLVDVKPDLAWSRAQQAAAMAGAREGGALEGKTGDRAMRIEVSLALAEVCFQLAFRGKTLSAELGRQDLYTSAADAASNAFKFSLAAALRAIGRTEAKGVERVNMIASMIATVTGAKEELPSWLLVEIAPRVDSWLDELDRHMEAGDNALAASTLLPPFFDVLKLPDAQARKDRLGQRALRILVKGRKFVQALKVLETLPETEPNRKVKAECCEESGQFAAAAVLYLGLGEKEKALRCYRSAPDFEASLGIVRELGNHPARGSLEWLAELSAVLGRRPENFSRVMTMPEKKLLEGLLEQGLGVQRRKPAVKKAAGKATAKAAAKPAVKKVATKTVAEKKPSARRARELAALAATLQTGPKRDRDLF